jgi:hypothetical protein
MMPIAIRAAALLALVLLPLSAAAQADPDTVRLRFGWRPGMQAQVEYEQVRTREIDGESDSTRIASTYRLEVEPHAEGLLIRYVDTRWTDLPELDGPGGDFFRALAGTESGGKPQYVVSANGEFLRTEGMEQLAAELRAAVQPLMDEMEGEAAAAFRNMMEVTFSDEGMASAVSSEWMTMAGFWVDAELDTAGVWEMEDEFETPIFPGLVIPLVTQFELAGWVPCTDGDGAPRCVELQMASFPDPEAMQQGMRELMQRVGLPEEEVAAALSEVQAETYVTLVTEPGTLRPHFLQTTKVVAAGDEGDAPMQVQTQTYRFRWR